MKQLIGLILAVHTSLAVYGFEPSDSAWEFPTATFHINIAGNSPGGESWNSAFVRAMTAWTDATVFDFVAVNEFLAPCTDRNSSSFGDGITGVDFTDTQCGTEFGDNVLAVTLKTVSCSNRACTGQTTITDADIVFNSSANWDVYSGSLRAGSRDFHRVALHELGHALGLDHEPDTLAIMQPFVSNIDSLQADDIEGANFIYGGDVNFESIYGLDITLPRISEFTTSSNSFSLSGSLTDADQTLQGRPIDIYQFTFANDVRLDLRASSTELNPLLYLVRIDSAQNIFPDFSFSNDNFGFGANARLIESLPAGTYWAGVSSNNNTDFGNYDLSFIANNSNSEINDANRFESIYGAIVEINPNPVISGTLDNSDFSLNNRFIDLYQITLNSTTTLRFELSSNRIDTKLLVVAIEPDQSLGSVQLENDDNGSSTNSVIEHELPAGTYWIGATSFTAGETGEYRIETSIPRL